MDIEMETKPITPEQHDSNEEGKKKDSSDFNIKRWKFDIDHLYSITVKFFKDNEGKLFHPSYDERNYLNALMLQVKHGPFNCDKIKPLGALDFVGRDRRQAWVDLGSKSKIDSIEEFIKLINEKCKEFQTFIDAHQKERQDREELQRLEEEKLLREEELKRLKLQEQIRIEEEKIRCKENNISNSQMIAIREALNEQTYPQFKAYAEQQYPANVESQNLLIKQLQLQHYTQYMEQFQKLIMPASQSYHLGDDGGGGCAGDGHILSNNNNNINERGKNDSLDFKQDHQDNLDEENEIEKEWTGGYIEKATTWRLKEIDMFKESIKKESLESGIVTVCHGEIVTVSVPTNANRKSISWEFATDNYDIGFGLFFEWNNNPGTGVTVQISDSDDEDDDDLRVDNGNYGKRIGDIETNAGKKIDNHCKNVQPCSVIMPIYRLDCHEEVFAGSHRYPGNGIYLLKFDNSYSMWRSKTLYYRVFYTS